MSDLIAEARSRYAGGDVKGAVKSLEQAREVALKRKSLDQLNLVNAAANDIAAGTSRRDKKAVDSLLYALRMNISLVGRGQVPAEAAPVVSAPAAAVPSFCPSCGTAVTPDAPFCASCGAAVTGSRPVSAPVTVGVSSNNGGAVRAVGRGIGRTVKIVFAAFGLIIILVIVAIAVGTKSNKAHDATASDKAAPVTGKVLGQFDATCILCTTSSLANDLAVSNTYCGWQDGKVIVHVKMTNSSVEHVTVKWEPKYTILNGGQHGESIGAQQSSGFDAGETRSLIATQSPEGVTAGSALASCEPDFWDIQSG